MEHSIRRHGLTQVSSGEVEGQPPTIDYNIQICSQLIVSSVVFVHGLFGHAYRTWASKGSTGIPASQSKPDDDSKEATHLTSFWRKPKRLVSRRTNSSWTSSTDTLTENATSSSRDIFWPQDLLPKALPSARVFTWGYDVDVSQFLSSTSTLSVAQHAETLLSDLSNVRTTYSTRSTKIIFVAHSLGGIVVKKALCSSSTSKTHLSDILRQTAGVCFLGTPHRGSRIASWGKLALDISKLFLQQPNSDIMRSLKDNSETLQYISQEFSRLLVSRSFHIYSFREEYPYHGVMIVDDYSSSIGDGMEDCSTIPSNHRDMTKFCSAEDTGFIRVSAILQRWESEWRMRRENFCLSSITRADLSTRIDNVEAPFEGTYNWILRSNSDVHRWLEDRTNNIFWISGIPGSGKSTAMKYAMRHPLTRVILTDWDPQDWVVAGFFFHELGTQIQKSVGGLYAEILFRILRVHRKLLSQHVEPIYQAKCEAVAHSVGDDGHLGDENRYISWSDDELRTILLTCIKQTTLHINACLFIDALDEHSGDRRQLLSFLQSLVSEATPKLVKIKLCLASRPENIFKDALGSYPGFAMQTMTSSDIRRYVHSMMAPELSRAERIETESNIQDLVQEIVESARSVFLWVNLVVPELIEGICDGDTIDELRSALYSIPPDLGNLYRRALQRKERRKLSDGLRIKRLYERWIIFRVALCVPQGFPLDAFMSIATLNSMLDLGDLTLRGTTAASTPEETMRRLSVRTACLIDTPFDRLNNRHGVRLIHQTAEEFIKSSEASDILSESLPSKLLQDGDFFISRYRLLDGSRYDRYQLKPSEAIAFAKLIAKLDKRALEKFNADLQGHSLAKALERLWLSNRLKTGRGIHFQEGDTPDWGKMVVFTYWAVGNPVKDLLNHPEVQATEHEPGPRLLATAMWCLFQETRQSTPLPSFQTDILQDTLDAGVDIDSEHQDKTLLETLLTRALLGRDDEGFLVKMFKRVLDAGADPNQETSHWDGAAPLHAAAKAGHQRIVDLLLDRGANSLQLDGYGKTYHDYLSENARLRRGADSDSEATTAPMIMVLDWE